jgi:hypothetical protein
VVNSARSRPNRTCRQELVYLLDRCQIDLVEQRPVPITRGHSDPERPQPSALIQDPPWIFSNTRDVDDTSSRTVGHRFTPPDEATVHDTIWSPKKVDGYVWTRIPGTDVEVRALTDRPLAVRYRASQRGRPGTGTAGPGPLM